jgi:multidrug efflux pump subunit AcrB
MGAFLREFGITVSVAVMVSLFVALSLTPMLAARMPAAKDRAHGSIYHRLERWFQGLETGYRNLLDWTLAHRGKTAAIALGSIAVAVVAGKQLPGEFFPSSGFRLRAALVPHAARTSLEATEAILVQNRSGCSSSPRPPRCSGGSAPT